MRNLYSLTKGQAAIRDRFRARHESTGNLPLYPGIFPREGLNGQSYGAQARRSASRSEG
jgi:hypothetical protein